MENLVLLIPEDYPNFAFESLAVFRFKSIQKIPLRQSAKVSKVLITENTHSGHFNPEDIHKLRVLFWDSFNIKPQKKTYIYISRAQSAVRHVTNELEVIEFFRKMNFLILHPEELHFQEQVELFSTCKLLVSIHGAGLTNCIFMPPGSHVWEFYREVEPFSKDMNQCFFHLVQAAGHGYSVQFCSEAKTDIDTPNDSDIWVDIQEVETNLDRILKSFSS